MVDNLIFLEFVDEARIFLKRYLRKIKANPQGFKIITFHPLVKAHLLKYDIDSVDSFHFCPTESHKQLLIVLEKYTEQIRKQCKLEFFGVQESYIENLLYSLRAILSTWLYRVEVISNTAEQYRPNNIISVGSQRISVVHSLWTDSVERYVVDIVYQICKNGGIGLRNLPLNIAFSVIRRKIQKRKKDIARTLLCGLARYFIKLEQNNIIALSDRFEMDSVLKDLKKELGEGYKLAFLGVPRKLTIKNILANFFIKKGEKPYRYLFYNVERKLAFNSAFLEKKNTARNTIYDLIDSWAYRRVSPAKWLKAKYRFGIEPEAIDKTYYHAFNLNRFLDKWRPRFVLSQHSRGMAAVMGELCKSKEIPSLMIPHGSFTPITDECSKKEWKENALGMVDTPYRYLALQTPLIEKFLSDVSTRSKPVITGPIILGRRNKSGSDIEGLRRKYAPGGEKIILHAGTPKHRMGQRFINYETIDEYVDGMTSLIKVLDNIKGVHLILRYRVIDGLGIEELKSTLPESRSYSIASDGSFADYLSIADLLVSYSSSTIEEALQNNIPVLLLNQYNRYKHIKGTKLSPGLADIAPSAVYNVDFEENLLFAIKWILKNHLSRKGSLSSLFDGYKYKSEDMTRLSDLILQKDKGPIKITPNSNFHAIGTKSILDSSDAEFRKYRYEWMNNPKQFKVRNFPLHVDIETTNHCNLKCSYCAVTHDRWGSDKKGKMSFELFKRIIDEGKEFGLYSIKFSLRGEPLLHEDLPRMIRYAKASGIIDMYFNTNGVLLSEERNKHLIDAGLNRISISCDSWDRESFERNRAGAKFEQVYGNILNLRKMRERSGVDYPKVRIQTLIFPEIREHWKEFLALWQPLSDEMGYLDPREEGPGIDHRGLQAKWACPFLWQRMVILWDGTILPCLLHGVKDSSSMEMGNIRDTSVREQWLSERMNNYRELHKTGQSHKLEACDRCSYRASEINKCVRGRP